MNRRRALMGETKNPHITFSVYNQNVEAGGSFALGNGLFNADRNLTILADIDMPSEAPASGQPGYQLYLICCWNQSINKWEYLLAQTSGGSAYMAATWIGSNSGGLLRPPRNRVRVAVTHAASSNSVTTYGLIEGYTLVTKTQTGTFSASNARTGIGRTGYTANCLPACTVRKIEVYDIVLDSTAINEFFA